MPIGAIIGSALIGGIGSIIGGRKASKAATQAQQAQTQAADQQVGLARDIYADQRHLQQPYYQAGLQGLYGSSGVMNLMGMGQPQQQQMQQGPPGGMAQPQPFGGSQMVDVGNGRYMPGGPGQGMLQGAPGNAFAQYASGTYGQGGQMGAQPGPDWGAYLQANPEVAEYYRKNPRALAGVGGDLNRGAELHYNLHGKREGRALPMTAPQGARPGGAPPMVAGGDGSYRPGAPGEPALQTGQPAAQTGEPAGPTEGPMTQTLRQTPGYQFMQDEGRRQLENSFAARGKLLSGSAMKALQERSMGLADQTYQSAVGNAFNLANLGMGSAAQITSAGNNFGNMAGNAFGNAGNAAAQGAYGRANAFNQGMQGVYGAAMGGLGMYGGSKGWFN